MSQEDTLAWLSALQQRFGGVLREPLDRGTGTLRAAVHAYDEQACQDILPSATLSERERLAVYNRQYWFRLFTALQTDHPLTTRLLGYWTFNEHAGRYLIDHPPRTQDLHDVSEDFAGFLQQTLPEGDVPTGPSTPTVARAALLEAVRIDAAFRTVFRARLEPQLQLTATDANRLASSRLRGASCVVFVEEHWPLFALRESLAQEPGERPVALPPAHDRPRSWALFRTGRGHARMPLAPLQARLFVLLCRHTVGASLAQLEAEALPEDRAALPMQLQRWLAEGMRLGFWTGLEPDADVPPRSTP